MDKIQTFKDIFILTGKIKAPNPDKQWYGVEWDITNSSPLVTRIGDIGMHRELPLQQQMKTAVLADNGQANYYLKADDWTKQYDNLSSSNLDGSDGMVQTKLPIGYVKYETIGTTQRVKFSERYIPGFTQLPTNLWIGSFKASLNRSTNKLASVVNLTTSYRGGNNNSAYDSSYNSLLGKPVTSLTRANFRTYARNRGSGWEMQYSLPYKIVYWLFVTEFATRNSQAPVNNILTSDGFHQGGLGNGVTTADYTEWTNYNAVNPFITCGTTNSLGNNSGEKAIIIANFGGTGINRTFTANRYRGIENPFGDIWEYIGDVNFQIQSAGSGNQSKVWICESPANWNDANYTGYTYKGLLPRANGYTNQVIFGNTGEIIPSIAAGGSSTFYCDYFYTDIPTSGEALRALRVGGSAADGSFAGFVSSVSNGSPSHAVTAVGSRLCFIGA